jgi:tetratricopeptide (TPR) repeat protein
MRWIIVMLLTLPVIACANPVNRANAEKYHERGTQAEYAGDFALAEQNFSRALWNARMGNSPRSGISLVTYNLGRIKGYLCKYDEAEELLLEALRLEEQESGPDSGLASMRLFELARLSAARGRFDEARKYYSRAIPIVRKLDIESSDPIGFADVLSDYVMVLESLEQHQEAIDASRESEQLRATHPDRQAEFTPSSYKQDCPEE